MQQVGRLTTEAERAKRRERVVVLWAAGGTARGIAAALATEGIRADSSTVARDIQALTKEWAAKARGDLFAARGRELASLESMDRQAATCDAPTLDKIHARLKISSQRRKLLGLDSPTRSDVTSGGGPVKILAGVSLDDIFGPPRATEE